MAMRRADLARVGGFERVANVLAEDHAFARVFHDAGMGVGLSTHLVENRNVDCSVGRSIERHTRWAKIRRSMSPAGFALEPLLMPVVVATGSLFVAPSRLAVLALVCACALQTAGAWLSLRILRGRALPVRLLPLEIVRSFVLLFCWARAWLSRRVSWRGHDLLVARDTVLVPAPPSALRRLFTFARG
jgi:ceramide glucosyltransferase